MKITFTGPESSGKSTISKSVADYFDAQWFAEHARTYLLELGREYDFGDIEKIALEQDELRTNQESKGLKIYDTENIVLYIWSNFKYKKCAENVKSLMENQHFTHYFLCSPAGIPWEEDPLRESPNHREELFELYLEELRNQNVNFTILEGDFEERRDRAIELIEDISLSKGGYCV